MCKLRLYEGSNYRGYEWCVNQLGRSCDMLISIPGRYIRCVCQVIMSSRQITVIVMWTMWSMYTVDFTFQITAIRKWTCFNFNQLLQIKTSYQNLQQTFIKLRWNKDLLFPNLDLLMAQWLLYQIVILYYMQILKCICSLGEQNVICNKNLDYVK